MEFLPGTPFFTTEQAATSECPKSIYFSPKLPEILLVCDFSGICENISEFNSFQRYSERKPGRTGLNQAQQKFSKNKAGYTAQDARSTRPKITRDGRTYGPTDERTDERTRPLIEMLRRI